MVPEIPLLGVKRLCPENMPESAIDPTRTCAVMISDDRNGSNSVLSARDIPPHRSAFPRQRTPKRWNVIVVLHSIARSKTMSDFAKAVENSVRVPWNKGKLIGAKPPLRLKHVWAIRSRLQLSGRSRDLALFNLGIDSKLRGCDLVSLKVSDIAPRGYAIDRAVIRQRKTGRPVKFELTDQTRESVDAYVKASGRRPDQFLFVGRGHPERHLTTRQYARLLETWLSGIGLDASVYGTHSMRRTKATLIYKRTGNLRAVQLLLGHTKIESTVRYLGVEVDDALAIAEQTDV
jgi:integrase